MELGTAAQILAFAVFALVSIAGAVGMTTTMSMFRSAIFLMASFAGVAGLFLLLMADLIGMLQIMMYVGGMLVMALFMVLFSHDPGGAMMTSRMDLPLVERFFSLGLAREHGGGHGGHGGGEHGEGGEEHEEHEEHGGQDGGEGMDMEPMFILENKKPALAIAVAVWLLLSGLILFAPSWPVVDRTPDQDSARRIGEHLMGKYMIAFEGAGLLILLGIFGAVYLSRPGRHPDPTDRERIRAAVPEDPAPIEEGS